MIERDHTGAHSERSAVFETVFFTRRERGEARFMLEQPFLAKKTTGIAGERAVRSDDPMTRHNNGDRIRAVRGAHRPTCSVFTEVAGELAVADCGSRWNGPKRPPDSTLEWRAASRNLDAREDVHAAGKIGI